MSEEKSLVVYPCEKIIFDVDNTILDTDGHFHNAQEKMLEPLEERGIIDNAEEKVEELREIDMEIADREGKNEYNFDLLSRALSWYYLENKSIKEAVEKRDKENEYNGYINRATNKFYEYLNSPHKLIDGFDKTYNFLRQMDSEIVAFSEGEKNRINRELEENGVRDVFDRVICREKKPESFQRVVDEDNSVVVGDSLKKDIRPANTVGCLTVHKPAGFCEDKIKVEPDIRINKISQVPDIFHSNGNILIMK